MPETPYASSTRPQLPKLRRARGGEEIRAGKPYARLVPLAPTRQREFGFLAGQVEITENFAREAMRPLSEEELADWE